MLRSCIPFYDKKVIPVYSCGKRSSLFIHMNWKKIHVILELRMLLTVAEERFCYI
jgi:hypothetical protein